MKSMAFDSLLAVVAYHVLQVEETLAISRRICGLKKPHVAVAWHDTRTRVRTLLHKRSVKSSIACTHDRHLPATMQAGRRR